MIRVKVPGLLLFFKYQNNIDNHSKQIKFVSLFSNMNVVHIIAKEIISANAFV